MADAPDRNAERSPFRSRIVGLGEVDPTTLTPHPKNPRQHPQQQLAAITGALTEVGFVQNIVINRTTGRILDGHARVEIAVARNEPTIPVVYVELDESEEALVLASLDPLGAMAGVDQGLLDALLAEVSVSDDALRAMLAAQSKTGKAGLTGADDVPEVPETPITQPGDLWLLGEHRLLCGDSTKAEDVARLMGDAKAGCVFTDPPYGVNIVSRTGTSGVSNSTARASKRLGMGRSERLKAATDGALSLANDDLDLDQLTAFLTNAFALAVAATSLGAAWYVTAPHNPIGLAFSLALTKVDVWRHSLVWVKSSLVL